MKLYLVIDAPDVTELTEEVATSLSLKWEDLDGNPKDFGTIEWSVYDHLMGTLYNTLTDTELDKTQFSFD